MTAGTAGGEMDAVTFTEVATVPASTTICTRPCESLVAVADEGVSVIPPTLELSLKLTGVPLRGPPEASSTLNTTVELSGRLASPVPLSAMLVGVAEMNEIDPIAACATVTVPVAVYESVAIVVVAEITSLPLQPLAEYVTVAIPVVVVTVACGWMLAVPAATQAELKVMVADWAYRVPSDCCNETVRLVLPPAETLALLMPITPA